MYSLNNQIANNISNLRNTLPSEILNRQFEIQPELRTKYSPRETGLYLQDTKYYLTYLAESIRVNKIELFEEYAAWCKTFLTGLGIPIKDLVINLEIIRNALAEKLSKEESDVVIMFANSGLEILKNKNVITDSFINSENELKGPAEKYLQYLLLGKRKEAGDLILELVENGTGIKEIYNKIFCVTQYEIGRLWQLNKISVAQEHYCTAATQLIMSQLYNYIFTTERNGKKMVSTCISGELHEMGARMVADMFELAGWDTIYLGANTPIPGIISTLEQFTPNILTISATMTFHIGAVAELIEKIKYSKLDEKIGIMVGGYPFKIADNLWKEIGADGFAPDAEKAVEVAEQLTAFGRSYE